ncbi:MAG: peptidyl-tRNA hydrolase [Candidatus Thorarchaeota archaeon]|nr:MAG: peptidyl-tRNA hydrolase [Candidatus Thorarchaeota archaeon]
MSGREFKFKQVIAVRTDLGMSKGKIAVQVAHGSVSASERVRVTHQHVWKAWFNEGQKKVAVKVASEDELLEMRRMAVDLGIPFALIRDAGMTELPPGTTTVIAVGPARAELIDKVTSDLKLL